MSSLEFTHVINDENQSYPGTVPLLQAGQVLAAIFCIHGAVVLICTLASLFQRRHESQKTLKPLLILAANTFFSVSFNVVALLSFAVPFKGLSCLILIDILAPLFGLSQTFGFLFLYIRASMVNNHKTVSRRMLITQRIAFICTFGVFPWVLFVDFFIDGHVFKEGCAISVPSWAPYIQLVIGVALSGVYLFLFIEPVYMHVVKMSDLNAESKQRMYHVAVWNLKLSMIALGAGVADFTFMAYSMSFTSAPLEVATILLVSIDVWVTNTVFTFMLSTWIPRPLKQSLKALMGVKKESTSKENLSKHSSKQSHLSVNLTTVSTQVLS